MHHGDVTLIDTMAQSYLQTSGAVAEAAANSRTRLSQSLQKAWESSINSDGIEFLGDMEGTLHKLLMITA